MTKFPYRDTIFLSANLSLGCSFPFLLLYRLVVLCFHSGCDSKLLICWIPFRDIQIKLRPVLFLMQFLSRHKKVGRDLIICSYFSFCRNLIFSVTTVFVYSSSVFGRDLKSMS